MQTVGCKSKPPLVKTSHSQNVLELVPKHEKIYGKPFYYLLRNVDT